MGRDRSAADPVDGVAAFADLRPQVLLSEVVDFLAGRPRGRDPWLTTLADYDDRHGAALIPSLIAYLDALGDVRRAAGGLGIHPNTLRYRVRRCLEVSGLDLDDPDQRLLAQLQLRLVRADRERQAPPAS
jgi:DNA-binding PucR family transcriptional regulator